MECLALQIRPKEKSHTWFFAAQHCSNPSICLCKELGDSEWALTCLKLPAHTAEADNERCPRQVSMCCSSQPRSGPALQTSPKLFSVTKLAALQEQLHLKKGFNSVFKRNIREFGQKWPLLNKRGLKSQLSNTAGSDRGRKCRVRQNKRS